LLRTGAVDFYVTTPGRAALGTKSRASGAHPSSVASVAAQSRGIPPLFKADTANLTVSASRDGKLRVVYGGWDDAKVVLPNEVLELRWGKQGVEGRILTPPRGSADPPEKLGPPIGPPSDPLGPPSMAQIFHHEIRPGDPFQAAPVSSRTRGATPHALCGGVGLLVPRREDASAEQSRHGEAGAAGWRGRGRPSPGRIRRT
jgi:hypothetical protein